MGASQGSGGIMVTEAKRTPLYQAHLALGARMIAFAGWEMPVYYTGILEEHRAVRSRVGLFDVSHLGRLEVKGPSAQALLQSLLTIEVAKVGEGLSRYSLLCREDGGILDDPLVYHVTADSYWVVCNSANTEKVWGWLLRWGKEFRGVSLTNITQGWAMMALQGPLSARLLETLSSPSISQMAPFACLHTRVGRHAALVARTGYTGEDGFELVVRAEEALALWELLIQQGVKPCGLGARNTLRLEAGFLLYGRDMDEGVDPFEVGLGRMVRLDKGDFIGREALQRIKAEGARRCLVGFEMLERGVARDDYPILKEGKEIGRVTTGSYAPSLDKNIGLGYVPVEYAAPGTLLQVEIRQKPVAAQVVPLPFYSRPRS